MQDVEAQESAIAARAIEQLQSLIELAVSEILPSSVHAVFQRPKEAVRACTTSTASADLQCHAPYAAWCQLRVGVADGDPVRFTIVSEYGVERAFEYSSARQLGEALVAALDEDARDVAADVRVREADGCLLVTTQLHMRRQRALGYLHCVACGKFFRGERGLRDHQHIQHTHDYGGALEAVAAAKGTLIKYTPVGVHLASLWAERASAAERERKALPPGLEAARDGNLLRLRELVANGFNAASVFDRHGSSALMYAAGSGHLDICKYLVDELGVPAMQQQVKDGRTPLHWAARNGRVEVCKWLLNERSADPNVGTHDGTRPLHWAIWQRQLEVSSLLLSAKADLHALNSYGCNASQWAAQVQVDDPSMCIWLLEKGLDLGVLNGNGHSALHKAAVKGNGRICEWLLSDGGLGPRHLAEDGDGNTPSLMARLEGHVELAEYLMASSEAALNVI